MTLHDGFDRTIAGWLDEQAGRGAPGYLDEILATTVRTRQRPAWLSLERWLPVLTTLRFTPVPRVAWLLVVLALIAALGAAAVWIGTQRRGFDPYGLAANGTMLYGADDGDIYIFNPATGRSTPLIDDGTAERTPFFSRDGSMFAFARSTCCGLMEIVLANADGTIIRSLTSPNLPIWADWSPDGTRLAVIGASAGTFSVVTVADGEAVEIELGLVADKLFWRPNGEELVFRGTKTLASNATSGLYLVRADGTGLRRIAPATNNREEWQEPAMSPDGTRIVYTMWDGDSIDGGHLYVVDIASGATQLLSFTGGRRAESEYFAEWSPDGTQLVLNRGTAQVAYHLSIASADGGAVVDIGPEMEWDAAAIAAFSPDGSKVTAYYSNGETWLLDAAGGPGKRLDIAATDLMTWQRVAP